MLGGSKALEIAYFCKHSQGRYGLNADKAGQLMDILFIRFAGREFFNPLVHALNLIGKVVKGEKILFQGLLVNTFRFQGPQPFQVRLCPVV